MRHVLRKHVHVFVLVEKEHLLILGLLLNFFQLVHVVSRCKAAAGSVIMTSCLLRLLPPTRRLQTAMWSRMDRLHH